MVRDTAPAADRAADDEAPPEAFLAALIEGFGLAIANTAAPALHRALDLFARAVLLDDTRPEPHLGLALCYGNLGDEGRALRSFDACLELGFGSGEYPELVYEFDGTDGETRVAEIGLDQVLVWRAACHLALGRAEPALRDLGRLTDTDDRELQVEVDVLRAKICVAEGDMERAQRHLSRALGLGPNEPDAHFVRGRIHELRGKAAAAVQAYSRAIKLDPEEPEFLIARARACLAVGDHRRAQADLQTAETLMTQQLPQPGRAAQIDALRAELRRIGT